MKKSRKAGSAPSHAINWHEAVNLVRIDELEPDPRNPRIHSKEQIQKIARSIERFGFISPILARGKRVVAGHGRNLAAKLLGYTEVPVIQAEHLTDAEARALMIADNRLTEIAIWDDRLLGEIFQELSQLDVDLNPEITGFSMGEIDQLIAGIAALEHGEETADDRVPEAGQSVSQVGDLWVLGNHRLVCGDALEPNAYTVLMDGKKAAMTFTDPPYNVAIDGHASGLGKIHHREFPMASGEMDTAQFTAFLAEALKNMVRHSAPGAILFACIDWRHVREMHAAADRARCTLKNVCVWVKSQPAMGSFYRSQHEFVFVLKNGKSSHRNNVQLGRFGRNRTNVWQYPGGSALARSRDEGNLLALHPTPKPVAMIADSILDCTARGDVVLDPFVGSGSTLIAAERTGRRCFGIELDPLYVDTAVRRWQAREGKAAIHAQSGRKFDDEQAEVRGKHARQR